MNKQWLLLVLFFCVSFIQVHAQLVISGQLRTRSELRDGQGAPSVKDTVPAFFTSQRTRINFGYTGYRFKIFTAIQDVRVWGQDGSSINRTTTATNNGLMLHEAWGELSLVDTGRVVKDFTLKVGRQELLYDDSRLLGNLDWLQQARRHDAALLKFSHQGWTAHLGAAYNQNAERKSNTIYNGVPAGYPASTNGMASMYKSLQFLYLAKKINNGTASFLAFKDDFSKFHFAPTDVNKTTPIYEQGVWSRYTLGGNLIGTAFKKLGFALSAFYQGGKYREGTSLNEYFLSASVSHPAGKKINVGAGVDMTSGNNGSNASEKYQRFDPLYGTPHKFWGYMDYFYTADGFGSNGLNDYYVRAKYKAKSNMTLSLDAHQFVLPSAVFATDGSILSKNLGTEVDFSFTYVITKVITIDAGYSAMFSTTTLASPSVKNIPNADTFSNWAYVMINIKPEFVFK